MLCFWPVSRSASTPLFGSRRLVALWLPVALCSPLIALSPPLAADIPDQLSIGLEEDTRLILLNNKPTIMDIRLGSGATVAPASPGQPVTATGQFSIRLTRQCLVRALRNHGPIDTLYNSAWLLLTQGSAGEHIVTGLSRHCSPTFRIDCPDNANPPTVSIWPARSETVPASPPRFHYLRLVTAGTFTEHHHHQLPPQTPMGFLVRLLVQFRNDVLAHRVMNLRHKLDLNTQYWHQANHQLRLLTSRVFPWEQLPGPQLNRQSIAAEQLAMASFNARSLILGTGRIALHNNLPLNHPATFYLHGQPVRIELSPNLHGALEAITRHMTEYRNNDRFRDGVYLLPREQYMSLARLMHTASDRLSVTGQKFQARVAMLLHQHQRSRFDQLFIPLTADFQELQPEPLQEIIAWLEHNNTSLYQQLRNRQLLLSGLTSLASGALSGALTPVAKQLVLAHFHLRDPVPYTTLGLHSLIGALYGGSSNTASFFLSVAADLPATISSALVNSMLQVSEECLHAWSNPELRDNLGARVINIIGQETFTGVGATLFYGNLPRQIAGASAGLLLWQLLNLTDRKDDLENVRTSPPHASAN